ncbi:MAG: AAA family ATPase [Desulfatiglans sp.]|jgi:CO dehydrogenase maturation factor|nr:AAA family ATPase [Thermodesulfobacteriota bacterium]MEE4351730.1 AAA family ATPase [Desulfatiglans sp.]
MRHQNKNNGRVVAITGKGGSGKTVLAATIINLLVGGGKSKILAIDADSAVCLPSALDATVRRTVGDIREGLIEDPEMKTRAQSQTPRVMISDVLTSGKGFDLLVMGRPEGPGCYCALNELLRYGIESLAKDYDLTIIDCEAGPEQVNRRVVRSVDTLLIVTDTSTRGIHNASLIKEITEKYEKEGDGHPEICLVVNRMKEDRKGIIPLIEEFDLNVLGFLPEDDNITQFDSVGKPIIHMQHSSPYAVAVDQIIRELGLL